MSRKEESKALTAPDLPGGLEPRWMRRIQGGRYGAVGLPTAAVAADSPGDIFDVLNSVGAGWPVGGWVGFGATLAAGGAAGYMQLQQRRGTAKFGSAKLGAFAQREGFATSKELKGSLAQSALRRRAGILRPSLAGTPLRHISPHALGLHLGTDVIHKSGLFMACEDTLLMIAPPRSGKSAQLGNAVIDAAGFCVVTSTRDDLYKHSHQQRREGNRPLLVFNADVAGVANTLRWNLVEGCEDPATAVRRAGFILAASASGSDMENSSFWNGHSFRILRTYLLLGALGDVDLMTIRSWVNNPDHTEPHSIAKAHADRIPEGWHRDLTQITKAPERTRDSIYMTLVRSFEFLALPQVAEIVRPRPGEQRFDVAEFIRARGTLYLMGRDRPYGSIAPLFNALVGEIHAVASLMADDNGGRLDPYGRFVLDEAAIICPLPLHQWTADSGGRNIQLLISVQSISQLKERWGQWGAQTIWTNSSKAILGGLSVAQDLEDISQLCGERDEETTSSSTNDDDKTSQTKSVRRVRVMPPDQIRSMKEGTGLLFHRALPPIPYRFTAVWDRPDVKAQRKVERKQEKVDAKLAKKGIVKPAQTDILLPPMPPTAPPVPQQRPAADSTPDRSTGTERRWTA